MIANSRHVKSTNIYANLSSISFRQLGPSVDSRKSSPTRRNGGNRVARTGTSGSWSQLRLLKLYDELATSVVLVEIASGSSSQ